MPYDEADLASPAHSQQGAAVPNMNNDVAAVQQSLDAEARRNLTPGGGEMSAKLRAELEAANATIKELQRQNDARCAELSLAWP